MAYGSRWTLALAAVPGLLACGCWGPTSPVSGPSGAGSSSTSQMSPPREEIAVTAPHGHERLITFDLPLQEIRAQKDAILTTITGSSDENRLGHVHSLAEDEDLHFSLDVPGLGTPVVCELMNALSVPPEANADHEYWPSRFASIISAGPVRVQGVFRIWPDHAAPRGPATGVEPAQEDAETSNPAHIVEIHPVSRIAGGGIRYDTRDGIAPITFAGEQYAYKDPGRWGDMLSHEIEADQVQRDGRSYLELRTPQIGFNYWELRARVVAPVTAVPNGHRFAVQILTPTRVYLEKVRCFTVAGTGADSTVSSLAVGSETTLTAIGRFDMDKILATRHYRGPVPVELCVFGINPPHLPAAGRRRSGEGPVMAAYGGQTGSGRYRSGRYRPDAGGESRRARYNGGGQAQTGMYTGREGEPSTGRYTAPAGGFSVIGNRRSHIYHVAGDTHLPAPANRIYFRSAEEAQAAGYRASRT